MIITDPKGVPVNWNNIRKGWWTRGRFLPTAPFSELSWEDQHLLTQWLQRMDDKNDALPLEVDGKDVGSLHYGDPPVVRLLWWTPLVELFITLLFCFIGYFGFHIIRSNEQTLLWVGLAKETAHQLGTPISSLLGWIDILRMRLEGLPENEKTLRVLGEMESDIARLNRVATRFSKIGSRPELKPDGLNPIVEATARYFQTRLPHLGKRIRVELRLGELPEVRLSTELISWVLENLLRNAVDSIEAQEGLIIISTRFVQEEGSVRLSVEDNGKGIPREYLKHIFSPGFTTKKRGWGLGLSLCRRIVEEYHEGRIYVERSVKDQGTVFQIALPLQPENPGVKA
jgi:light-regulated signal transduction histidine kinase (bacteriophytochrome)